MKVEPLPIEYENALVKRAQDGDDRAFRMLREQYDSLLMNYVTKNIPTYDPADIVQELDLVLYETIQQFDFSRNVKFITHLTNMCRYRISALIKEMSRDKRKIAYEKTEQIVDGPYGNDPYSFEPTYVGGSQLSSRAAEIDFDDVDLYESLSVLNETEVLVADLIIQGFKNTEIAKAINVRPWRVTEIRTNIMKKLRRNDGTNKLSFG
jgi:RNA polymerase sigma factor (sigma-70 family)